MKVDAHIHSKGISKCSGVEYRDVIDEKKKLGYNAIILTNHYQPWYFEEHNRIQWIDEFLAEYKRAYNYGRSVGIKVFLGVEVTITDPHYSDFLIYGCTEDFFYLSSSLCAMSQKQLFEYCNAHNCIMVQAHPFRNGHSPANPKYMHGVEMNFRPMDFEKRKLVEDYAKQHNLFITCGTDYHQTYQTEFGGMVLPDTISSSEEMVKHILKSGETTLFFFDETVTYRN